MDFESLGEKTIHYLFDKGYIENIYDLYTLIIELSDDICIKRVSGRYQNKEGKIYNISYFPKPKKMEFDEQVNFLKAFEDETGEELIQRDDDKLEQVKKRLEAYHEQTELVIEHYNEIQGVVEKINGNQDIDDVYSDIKKVLG